RTGPVGGGGRSAAALGGSSCDTDGGGGPGGRYGFATGASGDNVGMPGAPVIGVDGGTRSGAMLGCPILPPNPSSCCIVGRGIGGGGSGGCDGDTIGGS